MGLHGQFQDVGQFGKKGGIIPPGLVGDARQIEGHILQGAIPHPPGLLGILQVPGLQLETQPAAFGNLGRLAPVENEIGVALLSGHIADVMQKFLVAGGLEEFLGDMHQGFGEEEGPPGAIPFLKHLKKEPDESLGLGSVVGIGLSRVFSARARWPAHLKMLGDLPVEVDIGEDGLPAPGHGLLGEFKDQHLGQLFDLPVRQPFQVGGKEEVDRIPADGPGKMALQGRGELDHVGQQHFRVLGRLGHGQGVGQVQAEFFDVFQRLARNNRGGR